jgi:hypothetical protein
MKITPTVFDGLAGFELLTAQARLVVITAMGPRIAFFGRPDGENLLYFKNNDLGRQSWKLLGGHRVWVTRPGADESEDTYAADNDPCQVDVASDSIDVVSGVNSIYQISRGLHINVLDDSTFQVISYLKNEGPMLYSGGVWSPTCTDPAGGKNFAIPLGDRRLSWDVIKVVIPRSFGGHTSPVNDPQISFNEDFMMVNPLGIETKRMIMAPMGIIAMTWPAKNLSFLKHSPYNRNGQYPYGCNLALYVGPQNYMVEIETFGEQQTVLPGDTIKNRETWKLVEKVFEWQDPENLSGEFL